jgi:phosphatidylglycerophosphatase A
MKFLHTTFATWFGLGLSPVAPGTMGSIGTLPFLALVLYLFPQFPVWALAGVQINAFLPLSILIFFVAIPSVNWIIRYKKIKDPQLVVIDEVAGQTLAFAFVAPELLRQHWWLGLLGLVAFRIFDITKPLGIHKLESLPGAWGVMADDMLGGLYAGGVLCVIAHLLVIPA